MGEARQMQLRQRQRDNAEIANPHKQGTKGDTKDTLARQNKQHRILQQNKARTSRNHSKTKEMELDTVTKICKGQRDRGCAGLATQPD
jgi:hypothetical protein